MMASPSATLELLHVLDNILAPVQGSRVGAATKVHLLREFHDALACYAPCVVARPARTRYQDNEPVAVRTLQTRSECD